MAKRPTPPTRRLLDGGGSRIMVRPPVSEAEAEMGAALERIAAAVPRKGKLRGEH